MKATPVGLLPVAAFLLLGGGEAGALALVFLGVPVCFVAGMVGWRMYQEAYDLSVPVPPPSEAKGVLTQNEASEQLNDLIFDLWERDQCGH